MGTPRIIPNIHNHRKIFRTDPFNIISVELFARLSAPQQGLACIWNRFQLFAKVLLRAGSHEADFGKIIDATYIGF